MKKLFFVIPLFLCLMSCRMYSDNAVLSILSYNLYLMFDDVESGDEYSPFRKEDGWSSDLYRNRVDGLSDLLSKEEYRSDIMLFQEVESCKVLEDLIDAGLGAYGPYYYGIIENISPISVGYISKYRPIAVRIHSSSSPRPILELEFLIGGERISVFCLHAMSRLDDGGYDERRDLFSLLSVLLMENSDRLCIAAGDFNEDPATGSAFCDVERGEGSGVLHATGKTDLVDVDVFYTAALDSSMDCYGTYYYESFESFDHILLNSFAFDGAGYDFANAEVLIPPGGTDELGRPVRYVPLEKTGFSDHFAVRAELVYNT